MTRTITKTLACAGLVALASVAGMTSVTAVNATEMSAAAVTNAAQYRTFKRSRIQRRSIFGCYIKRQREQLPNGRWVIVERKVCPGPGKLAPRS